MLHDIPCLCCRRPLYTVQATTSFTLQRAPANVESCQDRCPKTNYYKNRSCYKSPPTLHLGVAGEMRSSKHIHISESTWQSNLQLLGSPFQAHTWFYLSIQWLRATLAVLRGLSLQHDCNTHCNTHCNMASRPSFLPGCTPV